MTWLRRHGPWAAAVAVVVLWALYERSGRVEAEARLEVERALTESRETLRAGLDLARAQADVERAAIEGARAIARAVADVEQAAAEDDIRRAAQDARDVDEEYERTGRVTESARRVWREMQREGKAP